MIQRKPLSRKGGSLKRTPLKRKGGQLKKKAADPKEIEEKKLLAEQDRLFYERIWASRPHFCQVCNTYLGSVWKKYMFDHLLEKNENQYPQFRHTEENIALVCGDCHGCKTGAHPKVKHLLLIEEAKQKLLNNDNE